MKSLKIYSGNNHFGFSLIEMVIVIALLACVVMFTPQMALHSISRSYALSDRDTLVSLLTLARAESLANVHQTPHGLFIAADRYVLFEGVVYDQNNSANQITPKTSHTHIAGLQSIVFDQLTANVVQEGTITITDDVHSDTIEVTSVGRINW